MAARGRGRPVRLTPEAHGWGYRFWVPPPAAPPPPDGLVAAAAEVGITLEGPAGRGGSAVVHRGRRSDGTPVAVKLLDVGVDLGRVQREADALAALDHDGIPALIDVIDVDGRAALITEWVDGSALVDELRGGPLSPARATAILSSLAGVLDHVHEAGIVHRDLSPDNIIVRPGDTVSVIDFGISRSADSATLTAEGITAGTPRYLAPEVLTGGEPTPASDQYAVGILLSEMVTGRWPYPDDGDTVAATMHHHLHAAPTPASEANPWLGTAFDAAILRAVAKLPSDRFTSVGEMVRSIDAPTPPAVAPLPKRSRWTTPLIGGVVLLAVIAAAVLTRGDSTDADVSGWPTGTAAGLACNLLAEPDFESGTVPSGFFDGVAANNDISPTGGVDQTAAVRVGATGDFGLYGETVPIVPGSGYVFRAFVAPTADTQAALIRLFTLDENFDLVPSDADDSIGADEVELLLEPGSSGHVTVTMAAASPTARFLVPSLVKEGADGYLLADELVLAPLGSECVEQLTE